MKSWVKIVFSVSFTIACGSTFVSPAEARPGDADTQLQAQVDVLTSKIKANAKDFDSILQRGILYRRLKELSLCEDDAKTLISRFPNNPNGYWLLSRVAKDRSDYKSGLKWIRECIKREKPNLSHFYYELGTLSDLNRESEVIERSIEIEKLFPRDGRNFYYRALARVNLGQNKEKILPDLYMAKKYSNGEPGVAEGIREIEQRISK